MATKGDATVYRAVTDSKMYLIDGGVLASAGLSGPYLTPSFAAADSIHPDYTQTGRWSARIAGFIQIALSGGGGAVRVPLSGGIIG